MPYWDHEEERRKILRLFSFVVFISPPQSRDSHWRHGETSG